MLWLPVRAEEIEKLIGSFLHKTSLFSLVYLIATYSYQYRIMDVCVLRQGLVQLRLDANFAL